MDFTNIDMTEEFSNEELIAQYLKTYNPNLDVSVGTPLRELVIIPAALYYTATNQDINNVMTNLGINTCTDSAMLEQLLGNYNVVRKTGTPGTGYIAVYSTSSTSIVVPQRIVFTAGSNSIVLDGTYIGVPDMAALNVSDLTNYRQIQRLDSTTYFIVIPARTAGVLTDVLAAGQTATMSETVPGITSAAIAATFVGGSGTETDEEMKARAAEGITAKVPSGKAHIEALCKNVTSATVYDLSVTGMGDVEMLRGKDNVYGVDPGGRVDIYLKTALFPQEISTTLTGTCIDPATKTWRILVTKTTAPGFYMVSEIKHASYTQILDYTANISYTYTIDTSGESYAPDFSGNPEYARFTKFQAAQITFVFDPITSPTLGQVESFQIKLYNLPQIDTLQNYFSDPETRNFAGDYLVKAAVPVFTGAELNIKYPDYVDTPDITSIQNAVVTAINATPMKRGYMTSADIAAAVKSYDPNLVVIMPIVLTGVVVKPDSTLGYIRSTDTLTITEDHSQAITKNTVAFFSSPSLVSVSLVRANQYMA
jgi:hypothetical protein